jgi:hypothetical protein
MGVMPNLLATVTMPYTSGLAEDVSINNFAIIADPAWTPGDVGQISTALATFYNVAPALGSNVLASYLGGAVSRVASACTIDVYDITGNEDGSPHGSPVASDTFTLGPSDGAATAHPQEAAMVITLRALGWTTALVEVPDADLPPDGLVDRPKQRHSGRLFLGPLNTKAGTDRPNTAFMDSCRGAVIELVADLEANGHTLSVWSRKDAILRQVTAVQTDNAWDTLRSRTLQPTVRTTSSV